MKRLFNIIFISVFLLVSRLVSGQISVTTSDVTCNLGQSGFSIFIPQGTAPGSHVVSVPIDFEISNVQCSGTGCGTEVTVGALINGTGSSTLNEFSFSVNSNTTTNQTLTFQLNTICSYNFNGLSSVQKSLLLDNTSVGSFTAFANPALNLNRQVTLGSNNYNPDLTGIPAQAGDIYTQVYTLSNNVSGMTYNGMIRFSELIPQGLKVNSLDYSINGTPVSVTPPSGPGDDVANIDIPVVALTTGQTITITEVLEVVGCLESGNGISNATISLGCNESDLCTFLDRTTTITPNNNIPLLSVDISNTRSDLVCFGLNTPTTRGITITNTGGAIARNVHFYLRNIRGMPVLIEDGSIQVITPGGTFAPFFDPSKILTHNNFFDDASYNVSLNTYDLIRGMVNTRFLDDRPGNFIYGANISSLGAGVPINILPGQTITIQWTEVSTCFRDDLLYDRLINNILNSIEDDITFEDECGALRQITDITNPIDHQLVLGAGQQLNVFNPIMSGDMDKCFQTRDGEIQSFHINYTHFNIPGAFLDADNAQLVYQLLLSPGLELDLSLINENATDPALDETYDHIACENCNQSGNYPSCVPSSLPVYTASDYNVTLSSLGNMVNVPINIVPILATPTINVQGEPTTPAKVVYEMAVSVGDLRAFWQANPGPFQSLNQFLGSLTLNYSLRSYCGPAMSLFQENFIYRYDCSTVNTCPSPYGSIGTEMTLASVGGRVDVLCPGCITPGATILYNQVNGVPATHFLRSDAFVGFPDDNNDGAPDIAILALNADRRLCTDGDVMEGVVRIGYSNGEDDVPGGFTKATMAANGVIVDNLYLDVTLPIGITLNTANVTATIIDPTTFTNIVIPLALGTDIIIDEANRPGHIVFRVTPGFDFNGLSDEAFVEIRGEYRMGHLSNTSENYDIRYEAMFSDCDNCTGGMGSFPNGDAIYACTGDPNAIPPVSATMGETCVDNHIVPFPGKYYLCEGGAGMIGYIPFASRFYTYAGNGSCNKQIDLSIEGGVYDNIPNNPSLNGFPNEYRTFFGGSPNPEITFTTEIPAGYRIAEVRIVNGDATEVNNNYLELLTVSPSVDLNAPPYRNGQLFSINLNYAAKTSSQAGYLTITNTNFNPATDFVVLGDDNFNTRVTVVLSPEICSQISNYVLQPTDPNRIAVLPVPLPDQSGTSRDFILGGVTTFFTPPRTNLSAIRLGPSAIDILDGTFIIPIRIDNTAPGINDLNGNPLPSIDAVNSYLRVDPPANSGLNVLEVLGSYNLATNTGNILPIVDGIVQLGTIPANTVNNPAYYYGVRVQYSCNGTPCNPLITCLDNPNNPIGGCLANTPLIINYGWNCTAYPSVNMDLQEMCENETIDYTLNTIGAGLNINSTVNGSGNNIVDVDNCQSVNYALTINSCHPGSINNFSVEVTFSNAVTNFTLTNSATLAAAGIVVTPITSTATSSIYSIVANGSNGLFSRGGTTGEFTMQFTFNILPDLTTWDITSSVNGQSYCGSSLAQPLTDIKSIRPLQEITINSLTDPASCGCFTITANTNLSGDLILSIDGADNPPAVTIINGQSTFQVCPTASTNYSVKYVNGSCVKLSNTINLAPLPSNNCSNKRLTECAEVLLNSLNDLMRLNNAYVNTVPADYRQIGGFANQAELIEFGNPTATNQCNSGNSYNDNQYGLGVLNSFIRYKLNYSSWSGGNFYKVMPLSLQCNFLVPGNDRDNLVAPADGDFINGRPAYVVPGERIFAVTLEDVWCDPHYYRLNWSKTGSGFNYMATCPPDLRFMISDVASLQANELYHVHFFTPKAGYTYDQAYDNFSFRDVISKASIVRIVNYNLDNSLCQPSIPVNYDYTARNIRVNLELTDGSIINAYLGGDGYGCNGAFLPYEGVPLLKYKEDICSNTCDLQSSINRVPSSCSVYKVSTATSLTGTYAYQWSKDGVVLPASNGSTITVSEDGNYSAMVTFTADNGLVCTSTSSLYIHSAPVTPNITASGPTSFCDGGSVTFSTSVVSGAYYQWNVNGTAISGATSNNYTADASGSYTVTTWFDNSCPVTSAVTTVTENPYPPTPVMTVYATNICQNGSVSVGVTYPTSPNTYTYTRPAGYILVGGGGGSTGFGEGVRLTQSGDFVLTYNTPQGCSSETRIHVNVTPVPATPTISASGPTTFCDGGSVTLSTSVVSGAFYQWNLNGTAISGATSNNYTADASGSYTVTTWFDNSCPVTSAATTVTENAYPANIISTAAGNICNGTEGSSSISYSTSAGPSVAFSFPPQLQQFSGTGGPGWAAVIFRTTASAVAGETYYVQGYTIAAGCTTTVQIPRAVIAAPVVPTITALNSVICQGGNAHLTTNATGVNYQWQLNSGSISGATSSNYLATAAGDYKLRVTATNGCTASSSIVTVTSSTNVAPRVTTNPDFTKCASTSDLLRAGQIISFNGTNDYISFPASGFTIPAGSAVTIEFWTYINTSDVGNRSAFQIGTQDVPNRCQAHVPWSDKRLYWDYGNAVEGQGRISTDFTNYLDKQTHVALVANGSKRAIYLNGQLANSFTNGTDPGPDNALTGLVIGKFLSYYYRGHLDQFRIWDTERTQTQIQQGMYEEYPGGTANLAGSWRFDEYGGNTIVNDVNSSYNGTLQGSYHARGFSLPAPTTFTWSPANGLNTTNGNSVLTSTTTSTTYYIRGSVANGCAHTASVNVAVNSGCKEGVFNDEDTLSEQSEWAAELYPNPSQDATNLIIRNADSEKVKIEIIDMKGVTIEQHDEVNTKEPFVFGANLRSGVYLIKIMDGKNYKMLKFVKQE